MLRKSLFLPYVIFIINIIAQDAFATTLPLKQDTPLLKGPTFSATAVSIQKTENSGITGTSVYDFGAKCDGNTDDSAAFNAAIAATGRAYVPTSAASGQITCVINTGITSMPSNSAIYSDFSGWGAKAVLKTTASVDTVTFANNSFDIVIQGISFIHSGDSGRIINAQYTHDIQIIDNSFYANSAINSSDMVYLSGSRVWFSRDSFTTFKSAGGFAIKIERTAAGFSIQNHIVDCYFGGTGLGVYVASAPGQPRPEGIYLQGNEFANQNNQLFIGAVLQFHSVGNTYDLGFYSVSVNISPEPDTYSENIYFLGDWFAGESSKDSVCIQHTGTGDVVGLTVTNSNFYSCGYGIIETTGGSDSTSKANNWIIQNNYFSSISKEALQLYNIKNLLIQGNQCRECKSNYDIKDGGFGPITLANNGWDQNNSSVADITIRNNWIIQNDTGRPLNQDVSYTENITTCSSQYFNVSHNLAATPDPGHTSVTISSPTSDGAAILSPNVFVAAVSLTTVTVNFSCTSLATPGNVIFVVRVSR
jgi:hypothetical protein